MSAEPPRQTPPPALSSKMSTLARADTAPELLLRKELFSRGLRYRVQQPVPGNRRRRIDVAFTRRRIAVFVDGCYWHGCPDHGTAPKANSEWWQWKFARNKARDDDTNRHLEALGWLVFRIWEHENCREAADRIEAAVRSRP